MENKGGNDDWKNSLRQLSPEEKQKELTSLDVHRSEIGQQLRHEEIDPDEASKDLQRIDEIEEVLTEKSPKIKT